MWSTHDAMGLVSAAVGFIPTLIHVPHQNITNCISHAYNFLCAFSNLLGWSSDSMAQVSLRKNFFAFERLIFLNSSLNPVIYCWRMRHIRRGIIDVLWNFLARDIHPAVFTIGRPMLSLLITESLRETYMNCVQFVFSGMGKRWQTQEYLPVRYRSQTTMVYNLLTGKDGFQWNRNARFIFDGQWNCCCW